MLSRRPIARLFDGLTDRLEIRMENRAVGVHNQTNVSDFEESDGIGRSLTIRLVSISIVARNALWDRSSKICMWTVGEWDRKIRWNLSKHEWHQIMSVNSNAIKLSKIGQWDADFNYSVIDNMYTLKFEYESCI